jgi:folate-dependent phosphoribosylglycinamide formyltransferase PurN
MDSLPATAAPADGAPASEAIRLDATRVVLLAADRRQSRSFAAQLPSDRLAGAVWESPGRMATIRLWLRRVERHGVATTASRLAALALDHLVYRIRAAQRAPSGEQLMAGMTTTSVNDPAVIEAVRNWKPTLVVVVGTTLLRPPLLAALSEAVVVNVHVGRTPAYRGTHGGAWALIEGRPTDVVTTLHLVDAGIDTGRPLAYLPVQVQSTMTGLARAQVDAGLGWLRDVIVAGAATVSRIEDVPPSMPLRYPPTLRDWRGFRRTARRLTRSDGR